MTGSNNEDDGYAPSDDEKHFHEDKDSETDDDTLEAIACTRPLAVVTCTQDVAAPP